jgi:20S proteasome alpha/beta subunit
MTVCIAAMAESGRKIVLASDRMITANFPIPTEFETDDVPKIYRLGDSAIAMSAGNALSAYEIIERAKALIASQQINKTEQIVETIRQTYQDYRRQRVIERTLEPRGLSLDKYYAMQQKLVLGVVQDVEAQLSGYNLQVEMIVVGCRDGDECHIFTITHPGVTLLHDALGHVSIGSGAPHVMYYFIGSDYKKSLSVETVEKIVRDAKKKSEVAPGVGRQTELLIIPETGNLTPPPS